MVLCQAYFEYSRENASPNSPGKIIYANKNPGFSVAGKPGNPTALSSHPHWCGFYICNCLFTTLVTRVGYLLLQYSALIDACRTREWIRGDSNSRVICISIRDQQYQSVVEDLHLYCLSDLCSRPKTLSAGRLSRCWTTHKII